MHIYGRQKTKFTAKEQEVENDLEWTKWYHEQNKWIICLQRDYQKIVQDVHMIVLEEEMM